MLPFVLLDDAHRAAFAAARSPRAAWRVEGLPGAVDLRAPGYAELFFDAVVTGLLSRRARAGAARGVPARAALHAGETHRLTDAALSRAAASPRPWPRAPSR